MAQWQPKRTPQERNTRAIRSMQNGTLDGRVLASPVRFNPAGVADSDDESDAELGAVDDSITLLPYTDTFTPSNVDNLTFTLTHIPWSQPLMASGTRNKASVHIYWNGVYQRDLSYSLSGNILTVYNDSLQIRSGDSISAKYFYEEGAEPDDTTTLYRMECWLELVPVDDGSSGGLWMDRFLMGAVEAPPRGQNAGTIKMVSTRFKSMEFISSWRSAWRLPKGVTIPTDSSVESITWMIDYDPGANVLVSSTGIYTDNVQFLGNDIGTTVGGQASCSGAFSMCHVGTYYQPCSGADIQNGANCTLCWQLAWGSIPRVLSAQPGFAGAPSVGPTGGKIFSEGADGFTLARRANIVTEEGTHLSQAVQRSVPRRGDLPRTCGSDDTIMGPYDFDVAAYDVKIGVTCVVVRKV